MFAYHAIFTPNVRCRHHPPMTPMPMTSTPHDLQVKRCLIQLINAMANHYYLELENGHRYIEFIVGQCSLDEQLPVSMTHHRLLLRVCASVWVCVCCIISVGQLLHLFTLAFCLSSLAALYNALVCNNCQWLAIKGGNIRKYA